VSIFGIIFTPNFVNQSVYLEVYMRRQTHTQRAQRFLTLHFQLYGEEYVSKSILSSVYGSIKSKYTVLYVGLGTEIRCVTIINRVINFDALKMRVVNPLFIFRGPG
jgi:hypothetical protein